MCVIMQGWRRRWFVFEGSSLRYYRSEGDRDPAGSIHARDITGAASSEEENAKVPSQTGLFGGMFPIVVAHVSLVAVFFYFLGAKGLAFSILL